MSYINQESCDKKCFQKLKPRDEVKSNMHLKGCRKGYSEKTFCFCFDAGQGKELVRLQLMM